MRYYESKVEKAAASGKSLAVLLEIAAAAEADALAARKSYEAAYDNDREESYEAESRAFALFLANRGTPAEAVSRAAYEAEYARKAEREAEFFAEREAAEG